MKDSNIPVYEPHEATVRISGGTNCKLAAKCALFFLSRALKDVEFFYIGANAGQQAMKAMGIVSSIVSEATGGKSLVAYRPVHVMTEVEDRVTSIKTMKDAVVWKVFVLNTERFDAAILSSHDLESLPKSSGQQ